MAALTSRWADTGAVRNTNSVIRNSWTLKVFWPTLNQIDDAISAQPSPRVEALVGPCRRL
jgi:hypothetical protein